jgi:hypothetical protein
MADYYVQVATDFGSSRLVDRARTVLGTDRATTIVLFLDLWSATLEAGIHGKVGERSDAWIEEAARWRGEPGEFAAFVRAHHLDGAGVIKDWLAKYGKLEALRERARTLKRGQRSRPRSPVPSTPLSSGQVDGHAEDDWVDPSLSSSSSLSAGQEEQQQERAAPERRPKGETREHWLVPSEWGTDPVVQAPLLGLIRSSRRPWAVVAVLRSLRDGDEVSLFPGAPVPLPVLARAAQQYLAGPAQEFSSAYFAGFIRRARGQKVAASEESYVEREGRAAQARDEEAREGRVVIDEFKRAHPERFAELAELAEAEVEDTGPFRAMLVTGQLQKLIRQEVAHAAR